MKFPRNTLQQRGFTLLEVMVSLMIISVGLLGVAKMQALSLTNTSVASMRSLAAIEAASLAATMHENRGYWSSAAPAANAGGIEVKGTGPGLSPQITAGGGLATPAVCNSGVAVPYCTSDQLAAYDLQQWAAAVNSVLPNYDAKITCTSASPVSCVISITWQERAVALNTAQAATTSLQAPFYTLYVEP